MSVKTRIGRRALLHGAGGIVVGLPLLNAMLNDSGTSSFEIGSTPNRARSRLPVSTARTPGNCSARATSIARIFACASGDLRILPTSMPGNRMSSV